MWREKSKWGNPCNKVRIEHTFHMQRWSQKFWTRVHRGIIIIINSRLHGRRTQAFLYSLLSCAILRISSGESRKSGETNLPTYSGYSRRWRPCLHLKLNLLNLPWAKLLGMSNWAHLLAPGPASDVVLDVTSTLTAPCFSSVLEQIVWTSPSIARQ